MSTYDQSRADRSRTSVASGSSTGAPGLPTGTADQRAQYHPEQSGYNSATGSGYTKPAAFVTYDSSGQDARIQHAPSTVQQGESEDQGTESRAARTGENVGQKARGVVAGVHGAGESLRGGINAAVDRAFGSTEGEARNDEIARRGESEIKTGEFASKNAPSYGK